MPSSRTNSQSNRFGKWNQREAPRSSSEFSRNQKRNRESVVAPHYQLEDGAWALGFIRQRGSGIDLDPHQSLGDLDSLDDDPQQSLVVVGVVPAHLDQRRLQPGICAEHLDYPAAYQRFEVVGRQARQTARILLALVQQRLAYVVSEIM